MTKSEQTLQKLDQTILNTEKRLENLYEQRREIINYLNLNKGKNNAKESISR